MYQKVICFFPVLFSLVFSDETGVTVAQAGKCTILLPLCLPTADIAGIFHHTQLIILWQNTQYSFLWLFEVYAM
jgi:hypothetical protein